MTTILYMIRQARVHDMITIASVEEVYTQLMEHLSDRFTEPTEAINRATHLLAKYYLNMEE